MVVEEERDLPVRAAGVDEPRDDRLLPAEPSIPSAARRRFGGLAAMYSRRSSGSSTVGSLPPGFSARSYSAFAAFAPRRLRPVGEQPRELARVPAASSTASTNARSPVFSFTEPGIRATRPMSCSEPPGRNWATGAASAPPPPLRDVPVELPVRPAAPAREEEDRRPEAQRAQRLEPPPRLVDQSWRHSTGRNSARSIGRLN